MEHVNGLEVQESEEGRRFRGVSRVGPENSQNVKWDQAMWSLAWEVGRSGASERMEHCSELDGGRRKKIRSRMEQERLMQDLIDQVKSGADSLELFVQGTVSCGHGDGKTGRVRGGVRT